jgi:hypothetical protein
MDPKKIETGQRELQQLFFTVVFGFHVFHTPLLDIHAFF